MQLMRSFSFALVPLLVQSHYLSKHNHPISITVKYLKMHNKSAENLLAHFELDNGQLFSSLVTIELLSKLVTLTTSTLLTIVCSQNDLYREHQPCSPIKGFTGTQTAVAESIKYPWCVHSRWTRGPFLEAPGNYRAR